MKKRTTLYILAAIFLIAAFAIPALSQPGLGGGGVPTLGRRVNDTAAGSCTTARRGWTYFNTTSNLIRVCNGTAWGDIGTSSGGSGTVTSVALAMPTEFSVAGSPITGSGTFTVTKASQSANLFFASPNGSAGAPTFRAMALADIPAIAANTILGNATGSSASPTAISIGSSQLFGRGSTGNLTAITLGTNLSMSGTTLNATGGGGSPAGSDTQVQFNSSGSFAGDAGFVWDNTSKILTLQNGANANVLRLNSTNANYPPGISFGFNSTNDNGPQIRGDFNGRLYLAAPIGQSVWIGGLQGVDGKLEVQGYAFETGGTATKINTRDAGTVGMTVKLATSQSANAFEVQPQSSTTPLMSIDASGNVSVPDLAYNATTWNGSTIVPTRNAIRDIIETLPFISSGAGVPGSTPSKVGDIYIDTTNDDAYIAVGTASSADWEKTNDGSGSGSPGGSSTQVQYNNGGTFGGVSGATSDGTNMTFGSANLRTTRPRVTTSIDDVNGNEVIVTPATASAVNHITVTNSATGNAVSIAASGDDTNIDLNLSGKGTGTVNIAGSGAGTLGLADTDASHYLNVTPGSNLTADRTLTVTTGDANRVLTISGDTTLGGGTMTATIGSGTAALGTSAITSGSCATVVTVSATGVATTDTITWVFNADPTSTTGYNPSTGVLTIFVYPTANNVNFKVCNTTAGSITPGAVTLNWRVVR